MEYKINNRTESITIFTEVEFTFDDGEVKVIDIAHFEPQSEDDILQNIQNRYESECLEKEINRNS